MDCFTEKFGGSISFTLECFDGIMIMGHLPFQSEGQLNGFVDHVLGIRCKDVIPRLELYSNQRVDHGTRVVCSTTFCGAGGPSRNSRRPSAALSSWRTDHSLLAPGNEGKGVGGTNRFNR